MVRALQMNGCEGGCIIKHMRIRSGPGVQMNGCEVAVILSVNIYKLIYIEEKYSSPDKSGIIT